MTIKRIFIYLFLVIILLIIGRFFYLRIAYDYKFHRDFAFSVVEAKIKWLELIGDEQDVDNAALDDSTLITLETTECYGFCPVYKLSLYGSGRAEFKGEKYVCINDKLLPLDKKAIRNLVRKLTLIGFKSFPNFQHVDVTDGQTYKIFFRHNNQQHSVNHYLGDLTSPAELSLVEADILAIVDKMAVLGAYSPSGLVCTMEGRAADLIPWEQWRQVSEETAIQPPELNVPVH